MSNRYEMSLFVFTAVCMFWLEGCSFDRLGETKRPRREQFDVLLLQRSVDNVKVLPSGELSFLFRLHWIKAKAPLPVGYEMDTEETLTLMFLDTHGQPIGDDEPDLMRPVYDQERAKLQGIGKGKKVNVEFIVGESFINRHILESASRITVTIPEGAELFSVLPFEYGLTNIAIPKKPF